jgi:DNA polymerase-1
MAMAQERLYLLDGMALAYRAYFSFISRPLVNSKGMNTGAIFGFTTALWRILDLKPEHVAVVFDTPEPTFRHKMYDKYKATRQRMPEDMVPQLGLLKDVARAFNVPVLELPGFEADDVIGTLARKAERDGLLTYLVTGDKDFMQLISPLIKMYKPGKTGTDAEIVDESGVMEKFGVTPDKVIDVLGLIGDTSDNVPGVPGVGEKTAIPLIQKFGSIPEVYLHLAEIPQKGVREKLTVNKELAELSRKLVTIDVNTPIKADIHELRASTPDLIALKTLFTELEFRTLLPRLNAVPSMAAPAGETKAAESIASEPAAPVTDITTDSHTYHLVGTLKEMQSLARRLEKAREFVFDTETTSTDPMRALLVGLAFSIDEHEAWYVPARPVGLHDTPTGGLFDQETEASPVPLGNLADALPVDRVLAVFTKALSDPSIRKIGQNLKYDIIVLRQHGVEVQGELYDTMIGSYILRPDVQHNLDALALGALNYRMISYEDLTGKGKTQKAITEVPLSSLAEYSAEDADMTLRIHNRQKPELEKIGLLPLVRDMEFPLVHVLVGMETTGICLDVKYLRGMSKDLERQLDNLVHDIYKAAGTTFNINSTQQLADILFNRLHLPAQKKTKTGYSTDVSVLESLRGAHPIIDALLEYRQLTKLKSTYVDALPELLHPRTGRVHTSYNQTVAATGRLSSSDPNLQNIPIRTEMGRMIRKAFVAAPGTALLSADYSQIELRIMAHVSGDDGLISAFTAGEDIHTTTAAKVFGVTDKDVTKDMRRKAKEVNFGIMYGIGAFGLKTRLGIGQGEAQQIIDRYFERFPGVRRYIQTTIESAKTNGYVSTLFGRRRYFPDITSKNQAVRSNAERAAINMPIQGTAADMIKVAMISIDRELRSSSMKTRMLLQVHDELVFEVPEKEKEQAAALVEKLMRTAMTLTVPILVEVGSGTNWLEAH